MSNNPIRLHNSPSKDLYHRDEFWTSKQRQSNSLHEISYRACFKAELPRYFIQRYTKKKDIVYDPFAGRGTTLIEAGLLGRRVIGNDINPLSKILSEPRFLIPDLDELEEYLNQIEFNKTLKADIDLSMFYHRDTEAEIVSLKEYILQKEKRDILNDLDKWIRMVATNRLTGHSKGFFSVYTMPPNQAVLPHRQVIINQQKKQKPEYKNVKKLILKKSKALIKNISKEDKKALKEIYKTANFLNEDARNTKEIQQESVSLTVTSPPFLDVVQYENDNWLRGWFNGINTKSVGEKITMVKNVKQWSEIMQDVFLELFRITKAGGYIAFEVGEVKKAKIKLEEYVAPLGEQVGFNVEKILINEQNFTKTANIWGVDNNKKGTNSNRIVLFKKGK